MQSDDLTTTRRSSRRHRSTETQNFGGRRRTASPPSLLENPDLDDDNAPLTLRPILHDDSGTVLSQSLFSLNLPKKLTESMLNYVQARNIDDLSLELLENTRLDSDQHSCGTHVFDIRRPFGPRATNMHWVAPANKGTFDDVLVHLGSGDFGRVLEAFGATFGHIQKLVCFEISFLTVSTCHRIRPHADLIENDHKAWNVLFPLVLVDNSVEELIVYSDDKRLSKKIKYTLGTAIILGDGGIHATNLVQYMAKSFRLMASVYIGDVTRGNARPLMADASHKYPGSIQDLLDMARHPHWTRQSGSAMPRIPVEDILGRDWYHSFLKLKEFKEHNGHCFVTVEDDPVLSAWAYKQREYYKAMSQGKRSKGMNQSRARLLASIGYVFVMNQSDGRRSVLWETKYQALQMFRQEHGHCNVTPAHKEPVLLNWVRNQRKALKEFTTRQRMNMSPEDLSKAERLDNIGFRWVV